MSKKTLLTCFAFLFLLEAQANTHLVTSKNASGAGSITEAIQQAQSGDTITFDTAVDTINWSRPWGVATINIDKDLTIIGNNTAYRTPLNVRSFWIDTVAVKFQNMIFIGCPDWGDRDAIQSTGALTLHNCQFLSAALTSGGSVVIDSCEFNSGASSGLTTVFLNLRGTSTTIDNSILKNISGVIFHSTINIVASCYFEKLKESGSIGTVSFGGDSATVTACTFSGNSASNKGGAIGCGSKNLSLTNCTFYDNQSASHGGAIYNVGNLGISHCTFGYNKAKNYGGAIYNYGDLSVQNSLFAENVADELGDDLYNQVITGSTFSSFSIANTLVTDTADCHFNHGSTGFPTLIFDSTATVLNALDENTFKGVLTFDSSSPALNAGNLIPQITSDQKGNQRDNQPDLGAWEYQIITSHSNIEEQALIYPNPAKGFVTIKDPNKEFVEAKLYSINGVLLLQIELQGKLQFDLSAFPTGLYLLHLITKEKPIVQKLQIRN